MIAPCWLRPTRRASEHPEGSRRGRRRHRVRGGCHRPRHRHRHRRRQRHHRHGPPTRVGRRRAGRPCSSVSPSPRPLALIGFVVVHPLSTPKGNVRRMLVRAQRVTCRRSATSAALPTAAERTVPEQAAKACPTHADGGTIGARRHPTRSCPRANEILWGLAFLVLVFACGSSAPRPCRRHEGPRGQDPQRPRRGREGRAEAEAAAASTSGSSPTPGEANRIIEEARQSRPTSSPGHGAPGRARRWPSCAGRRHRGPRRPQRRDGPAPHRPGLAAIDLAEKVVGTTSTTTRNLALVDSYRRPGREPEADGRPQRRLRRGAASRSPGPRATSTRSRTSCSASPAPSRATTTCACRSRTTRLPVERALAVVEELLGARRRPQRALLRSSWRPVAGADLPEIIDRLVALGRPRARESRRRDPHRRSLSTTTTARARGRADRADRQAGSR